MAFNASIHFGDTTTYLAKKRRGRTKLRKERAWCVFCAAASLNWWCWLLPKLCCESFTKLNDFRSDESGLFKRSLISTKFDW
ncbi:hypothetical protein DKX38_013049 [Salix brachista]|uniref:Uncharacterized protein n=1 Tax=Salix brachista TaxID=2182728 RepID=A0A5N5LQA2_9ROSI|nr:hypothetical protein DKX38_013049 [Salix brachista]